MTGRRPRCRSRSGGSEDGKDGPVHYRPPLREPVRTIGRRTFDFDRQIVVMGIVNRTPDSFFDGGRTYSLHDRSEEHTSELQSRQYLVCRLLLEKKKKKPSSTHNVKTHHDITLIT